MKLKALFMEEPVDFEKRCRLRILVGKTAAVLGLLSVAAAWFYGNSGTVAGDSFIQEFYTWIGDRLYGRRGCIRLEEPEISEG